MSNVLQQMRRLKKQETVPGKEPEVIEDKDDSEHLLQLEALRKTHENQVAALQAEVRTLRDLLQQSQSEVVKANDLVKSLNANVNLNSIAIENLKTEHKTVINSQNETIKSLELALITKKQQPQIQQIIKECDLPELVCTPVRDANNKIVKVMVSEA